MTYMFMNHRSKMDSAYIGYRVTVDTRPDVTPVEPYWLDVENCNVDPVYDVAGGKPSRQPQRAADDLDHPEGRQAGRGRRARARRRTGARAHATGLRHERRDLHLEAHLGRPTSPVLQGAPRAPRARSDPHERLQLVEGDTARRRREGGAEGQLRRGPAAHARDGNHDRVHGARPVRDRQLRRTPGRHGGAAGAVRAQLTAAVPRADRGPPRRQGREHQGAARQARAPRQARNDRRRRPLLPPAQRDAARGRNAHVALRGDTLHNITLANGPRGFSSPNLSRAASTGRS